jgi:TolB-like protein
MPLGLLADSGDGSFVAAGLVLDVIGRLTRFRRLDAIAHASSAALAGLGLTPREIGRRLGVRYITEGALWFGRSRLRVNVDLIETSSERVLWSEQFDRPVDDVFDVVDEIAASLTAGLLVEIEKRERVRVRARDPDSLDAYGLCVRGLDEMSRLDRGGCDNALMLFTRAVERERGYARALSGISRAHGLYWKYRWAERREEALARADEYALLAVDSDVNDAAANAALGWVALYSRSYERSLAAYQRAMELNPSDADILAEYADALGHSGANEEAIPLFQRAIRLNPHMSDLYAKDLAYVYLKSRHFDEVIKTVEQMRRPQIADLSLVAALAHAGRIEEARVAAEGVRRARPGFSPEAWVTMVPDRNPDDTAFYLEGMKRAGL